MRWSHRAALACLAATGRTPVLAEHPSSAHPTAEAPPTARGAGQGLELGALHADWVASKLRAAAGGAGLAEALNAADTAEVRGI